MTADQLAATAPSVIKAKHTVTFFVEPGEGMARPTFTCHGDQSSLCHWWPDCDHENACDCAQVPHDTCNTIAWLHDSDCGEECYDGKRVAITSAAAEVVTYFNGDCLDWSFKKDE